MDATDLYTGAGGRWYWDRNYGAVEAAGSQRRVSLRGLVEAPLRKQPWLELGCGIGANLLPGDVGVDCDRRVLACVPAPILTLMADARDLSIFLPSSFGVVFCVGLLMHFPKREALTVVKEMARIASDFVLTGEYEATKETDLRWNPKTGKQGRGTPGLLWARPYAPLMDKAGLVLVDSRQNLPGFEPQVTFSLWRKTDARCGAAAAADGVGAAGAPPARVVGKRRS